MKHRIRRAVATAGLLAFCSVAAGAAPARFAPRRLIPVDGPVDVDQLLRQARIQQAFNSRVYYDWSFRQTSRVETLDSGGDVEKELIRVYRVIPSREGTIRHLLEENGDTPSEKDMRKQRKRNETVRKRWAKIRAKAARQREREEGRKPPPKPGPAKPRPQVVAPPKVAAADRSTATPAEDARGTAERNITLPSSRPLPSLPVPEPRPPCDLEDPSSSVRPPSPGGKNTSSASDHRKPQEVSRRDRKTAGDYTIFELLSLTNYDYVGTCETESRIVHVVGFAPPEQFDPLNPVERVVTAMLGYILIDADELQIVRIQGETVAPIKWGGGLVALKRAKAVFEQQKVRDQVWLPALDYFEFDSRVLLSRDRQRVTHYYDDYKRTDVQSEEVFEGVASGS
jgi:hypothetical protein